MELTLTKGRPVTNDGRLEKEIRTYDLLDSLEIEYERVYELILNDFRNLRLGRITLDR